MSDLEVDVLCLRDVLSTAGTSAGLEFAQGFVRRIMIARAIIGEPRVLILDEAFNGIEEPVKQKLMDRIYAHGAWTLITVTDDGRPHALAREPDAFLCEHFPQLVASLRTSQPTSA